MKAKIFRPLIDLPKDSKARERFKEKKPKWTAIENSNSLEAMFIQNHELAKIQIAAMNPEILANVADRDGMARVSAQLFHNPTRKQRVALIAVHHWEGDDDPDMLECGWSATIIKGPESEGSEIKEWAKYLAELTFTDPLQRGGAAQ